MLSGVGSLCLTTTDYGVDNFIFPGNFVGFKLTPDVQSKEAKGWVGGQLQTLATAISSTSYTLTLDMEMLDWNTLGWAFDEVPQVATNAVIPYTKAAVATSAGVINDAAITSGMTVFCYVAGRGAWGDAGPIPKASVTVASGTITLGVGYANAPITYHFKKTAAQVETIGVLPNGQKYGKLSFSGVGFGPEFPKGIIIVVPEITRKSSPSFETADVPKFTVEYGVSIPQGSDKPLRFYNLDTITTP